MDLVSPITTYISGTFSPQEAEDAQADLTTLSDLRRSVVSNDETSHERRRETLLSYYRALSVVESRFPISGQDGHVFIPFSWCDGFKPNKTATLANVHFEKAAVLFNLGASWSQAGVTADRTTSEGIKVACHAFQHAAGAFATLKDDVLGKLGAFASGAIDSVTPDLTQECLGMLTSLHLAQAQECFYDKAAGDGKSSAVCVKLANQTRLFYEDARNALDAAPLKGHIDKTWHAHAAAKAAIFHVEALNRASKIAEEEDEDIGTAIARLMIASRVTAEGVKVVKSVNGDGPSSKALFELQVTVDESLRRANRDNECVYMVKVPSPDTLPPLGAAAVVKAVKPAPETLSASSETMFATIVPESGFKALSKYTEMVDSIIREENDVLVAASDEARMALKEMEMPDLLIAAVAGASDTGGDPAGASGAGLPPPLDEEVGSIQRGGGVAALIGGLPRLLDINEACTQQLAAATRMLEAESTEDESCRMMYGPQAWTRPNSADLNANLYEKIRTYTDNLEQAARSDESMRRRIEDAMDGVLALLDPTALVNDTPKLRAPMLSTAEDSSIVPELQSALGELEALGTERAKIEDTMKALKENDNIMSKVMAQTDAYDELFERELVKYDAPRSAVAANVSSQSDILSRVRSLHGKLLQTYDVTEWRAATRSHAEAVREAAAHYRLLASGMEQGLTFYSGFTEAVRQLGSDCEAFVEGRRKEKGELEQAVARRAQQAAMAAEHAVASAAAASRAAADQAAAQRAMSEAQAMVDAQRASAAQMQRHHYSEHAAWHASAAAATAAQMQNMSVTGAPPPGPGSTGQGYPAGVGPYPQAAAVHPTYQTTSPSAPFAPPPSQHPVPPQQQHHQYSSGLEYQQQYGFPANQQGGRPPPPPPPPRQY